MMQLRDFLPQVLLMLAGGLATSIGAGQLARSRRGRAVLAKLRWWGMTLLGLTLLGASVGGLYWLVRVILHQAEQQALLTTPGGMLLFGLLVGLPFALPTLIAVWSDETGLKKKPRAAPATKDDRRAFAEKLAKQIVEVSERGTEVTATVGGDGGRVLFFDGDLAADQGEKLVAALRGEMKELGFKRVEGKGPKGAWWTTV